jgi:hypothetical protein
MIGSFDITKEVAWWGVCLQRKWVLEAKMGACMAKQQNSNGCNKMKGLASKTSCTRCSCTLSLLSKVYVFQGEG